jgi:hypothetical protein
MAKYKTAETETSVVDYANAITDEKRRKDFTTLIDLITKDTGFKPKMWGPSIVGFGSYHYKYDSGREGDAPLAGMASRANAITLYIGSNFEKRDELLAKLGKHKLGGGCIHIKQLADIDTKILIQMVKNSIAQRKKEHGG